MIHKQHMNIKIFSIDFVLDIHVEICTLTFSNISLEGKNMKDLATAWHSTVKTKLVPLYVSYGNSRKWK